MTKTVTFVHLSDIHFDTKNTTLKGPNMASRVHLIEDLKDGAAALGTPDAVLVTGDVAFSGQDEQYAQAREFLQKVTETVGIAHEKVQVVPGNHDVDRAAVGTMLQMAHTSLRGEQPPAQDHKLNSLLGEQGDPLFAPLSAYNRFAAGYACVVTGSAPYWELPIPLGDSMTLLLRGLTTVLVSDVDDVRANMIMGTTQTTLTHDADTVVAVLGHHPPDWWQDMDEAEAGLRRYASVHLYGHKHVHHMSVIDDSVRVVAGAVHPERQSDWQPRYNWLRLSMLGEGTSEASLQVEVWPRFFNRNANEFRSDSRDGGWSPDIRVVPLHRHSKAHRAAVQVTVEQPAATTDGRPSGAPPVPAGDESREEPLVSAVVPPPLALRPPLTDAAGQPTELRRAVYMFMDLGFSEQRRILSELDLLTEEDRDLGPHETSLRAFARARELDRVAPLLAKVQAAADSATGPATRDQG